MSLSKAMNFPVPDCYRKAFSKEMFPPRLYCLVFDLCPVLWELYSLLPVCLKVLFGTLWYDIPVPRNGQSFKNSCQVMALAASWLNQIPGGSCTIFRNYFLCTLILSARSFSLHWVTTTIYSSVRAWVNGTTEAACIIYGCLYYLLWHNLRDGFFFLSDDTLHLGCVQCNLYPTAWISLLSFAISETHWLPCYVFIQQHLFPFEVLTAFL